MRKIFFGLLLLGAAGPAFAAGGPGFHIKGQDDDSTPRHQPRVERPARDQDDSRSEQRRPVFVQRPQVNRDFERPAQPDNRSQFRGGYGRPDRPVDVDRRQAREDVQRVRPVIRDNPYVQMSNDNRNWRQRTQSDDRRGITIRPPQQRYSGSGFHIRQPGVAYVPRQGTQPPRVQGRHRDGVHWNTDWRRDRRYDWRDRRRHHSSLFRIGVYYDPFGWNYQPYSIGYRLWPNYYQQNYWIDPGMYGLPYPPPGLQWVRYWNDALLVDVYSGQVVDVINGFFW